MLDARLAFQVLGLIVVAAPATLFAVLGLTSLARRTVNEARIVLCVQLAIFAGLLASIAILALMLALGTHHVPIELGHWVSIPRYHFSVKFGFDLLSIPFVILTFVLCGTIGAFCSRYMHCERGFRRFFVLYSLFVLGMVLTAVAGTIETLFAGWELVGLSSAMLVAFYHERRSPVQNGLRVWSVYRLSDAALLMAAVLLHHVTGDGGFDQFAAAGNSLTGSSPLLPSQQLAIGLLLLLAAMGKSALVPFSGWLPRAMEGPTPSSAVFYGALSVHLGAFLLLRVSPLLDASLTLRLTVIGVGLVTAIFAAFAERVQTDIKSALSFASLSQVGLIVVEIGLGLRFLALVHLLGHACVRTLQFLRAPTLLHDYRVLENAIGTSLAPHAGPARGATPFWRWLYRLAQQRGYLDALLTDYLVAPVVGFLRTCDELERRWTRFVAGESALRGSGFQPERIAAEDSGWKPEPRSDQPAWEHARLTERHEPPGNVPAPHRTASASEVAVRREPPGSATSSGPTPDGSRRTASAWERTLEELL